MIKLKLFSTAIKKIFADNINAYLLDSPNIFVESRSKHIKYFVPAIGIVNMMAEDDNFKFISTSSKYIRQILVADEFINNKLPLSTNNSYF